MKRTLAGVAATTLAVGGMLVATATPSSAHQNQVEATCSTLTVDLENYAGSWSKRGGGHHGGGGSGRAENTITVVIDGDVVADEAFGSGFERSFTFDPTTPHTWSVKAVAHDDARYNIDTGDTTKPCTDDATPSDTPVQVGIYVYPKLEAKEDASWWNSGKQGFVTSREIDRPENPNAKTWVVSPLDLDDLRAVAKTIEPDVTTAELCSEWGVQQDLVDAPAAEYTLPPVIEKASNTGIFPDGYLIGDDHQDVGALLPQGACDEEQPPTDEPADVEDVLPALPAVVDMCGTQNDTVTYPESTDELTYEVTESNLLVARLADGYAFAPAAESELGYVVSDDGTSAAFDLGTITFTDEDCALIPSGIGAVCVGDTPYLDYGVSLPEGVEVDGDTPLTITFLHPDGGENYVATDQPLEGQLLWPGASDTAPKQWPGWEQQDDGSYVETDGNYAWTREGVEVLFEVNPEYSQLVSYPEANTECANPVGAGGADVEVVADDADDADVTPAADAADELPQTGATVGVVAGIAALLVVGGAALFWLRRRIQH